MLNKIGISLSVLLIGMGSLSSVATAGDAANGESIFNKKCKSCHVLEAGARHKTGPNLAGMMSRKAGTAEGYKYSKNMAAADITWDDTTLDQWLEDPRGMVKSSKMTTKTRKEDERQDLIAYLMSAGM